MWIQIVNRSVLSKIMKGDKITDNPQKTEDACEVVKITPHYIKALKATENKSILISPQRELLSGKWWVEKLLMK